MRYLPIPGLADHVSRLVLGTLAFRLETYGQWAALVDRFVEAGGNAIDTGLIYEGGESERVVGRWLRGSRKRDDVVVITKGAHHAADGTHRVTPTDIAEDLARSLDHLEIQRIDLYMLHRDDPSQPVAGIVDRLNEHIAAGRISAIGASNWTHQRIQEANVYASKNGLRGFVASSPNLALAVPKEPIVLGGVSVAGDRPALEWYYQTKLPLLAWSSGASGFFSGRFGPDVPPNPSVGPYYMPDNWERLRRVQELAQRRGVTPTQVALAWTLRHPFPVFPLIGPRTAAELDDCLGALDVELSEREWRWLNLDDGGFLRRLFRRDS